MRIMPSYTLFIIFIFFLLLGHTRIGINYWRDNKKSNKLKLKQEKVVARKMTIRKNWRKKGNYYSHLGKICTHHPSRMIITPIIWGIISTDHPSMVIITPQMGVIIPTFPSKWRFFHTTKCFLESKEYNRVRSSYF